MWPLPEPLSELGVFFPLTPTLGERGESEAVGICESPDLLTYPWFPRNTEKLFGGSVSQVFACAKRRTGRIPARESHSRGQNCGKLRNGISCLCQEFWSRALGLPLPRGRGEGELVLRGGGGGQRMTGVTRWPSRTRLPGYRMTSSPCLRPSSTWVSVPLERPALTIFNWARPSAMTKAAH